MNPERRRIAAKRDTRRVERSDMTDQEKALRIALTKIDAIACKSEQMTGKPPQVSNGYADKPALKRIHELAADALRPADEEHTDDGIN